MKTVKFTVEPSGNLEGYFLTVDGTTIALINDTGSITLSSGIHFLVWFLIGDPGSTIKITGEITENGVTKKIIEFDDGIAPGRSRGGGKYDFEL